MKENTGNKRFEAWPLLSIESWVRHCS